MKITLVRGIWRYADSQVGLVYSIIDNPIFALELPWKNNQKRISCIPKGCYKCIRMASTKNKKWKEAFFVKDVPNRSSIIFGHIANKPSELLGCVGFGLYHDKESHISNSTEAIYKWRDAMKNYNEFDLEITD